MHTLISIGEEDGVSHDSSHMPPPKKTKPPSEFSETGNIHYLNVSYVYIYTYACITVSSYNGDTSSDDVQTLPSSINKGEIFCCMKIYKCILNIFRLSYFTTMDVLSEKSYSVEDVCSLPSSF